MTSNADAHYPCCGAQEPDWNGAHADPGYIDRGADNERLRAALKDTLPALRKFYGKSPYRSALDGAERALGLEQRADNTERS